MKPEPLMEWCNEGKRRGGGKNIRLERRIEPERGVESDEDIDERGRNANTVSRSQVLPF